MSTPQVPLDGARSAWMGVGAPVLGLVLIIIMLSVAVFASFAREQDNTFERSTSRLVSNALDGRSTALASVTVDYANWTQAFENTSGHWNETWVGENIYSNVVDAMIITDGEGQLRYSWFGAEGDDNAAVQDVAIATAMAAPELASLLHAASARDTVAHVVARAGDKLLIIAVAPFTPEDDDARMTERAAASYLINVDVVGADELQAMGASLDLSDLRFVANPRPHAANLVQLPLEGAGAAQVGGITWRHAHPGAAAFRGRVGLVVLTLLVIGALALLTTRIVVQRQIMALANAGAALESSRAKSEFLTRVGHELRTPLNAILGYAEMIEEEHEGQATARDAGHIIGAARHLSQLLNDIIDKSRIDAKRINFTPELLPVSGIVGEVQGLIRPAARDADVTLTAVSETTTGYVYADHLRLRQCLLNLLGNAVKFSRGGEVQLHALVDDSGDAPMVQFFVRDNGIGIARDEIANIFRPFGQANKGISATYGGTGLGLSITRDLAREMGGEISVESTLGEGSVFTLTMPLAAAQTARAA